MTQIYLAHTSDELIDTIIDITLGQARPAQLLLDIEMDERLRQGLRADPLRGHIVSEYRRQIDAVQMERESALDAECAYESFGDEDDAFDPHRAIDREHPDGYLDGGDVDELLESEP